MRLKIQQFIALTGLTVLDAVRQPLCLLLLLACVVFISLLPFLNAYEFGEAGKLVRDSSLAVHMVCGLVLGSFLASTAFSEGLNRETASSILSKPVDRSVYFIAKYAGVAIAMLGFALAVGVAVLLSCRVAVAAYDTDWWAIGPLLTAPVCALLFAGVSNYFTKRNFISNAWCLTIFALMAALLLACFFSPEGVEKGFGRALPWNVLPALLLSTMSILLVIAVAALFAVRLAVLPVMGLCLIVFLLGLVSDYFYAMGGGSGIFSRIFYCIIPNWHHFWAADALTEGGSIPWSYVRGVCSYTLLYSAGVLCLGAVLFREKEINA